MKNHVFTWACGEKFLNSEGFNVFLKSFNSQNFAKLTVFSDKFHNNWENTLRNAGHDAQTTNEVYYLLRDRWYHYAKKLYTIDADYVLLCDSKDILFQDDPFKIINDLNIKGECIVFCDEGINHRENDWNGGDQFRCQIHVVSEWKKEFLNRQVLNGGFVIGTPKKLAQLSIMIWTNMIRNPQPPYSDQAMINFLYFWIENDPEIFVCNPIDHNLCITGQGIIEEKVHYMAKNGCFFNISNEKYYAFHQWDRTCWADDIKDSFLS